jgi:hypothetical protein
MKRLNALVPHTSATPLKTLRSSYTNSNNNISSINDDDDDDDDDFQSILFNNPFKDGFASDDDDAISFITALTFDTLIEEDTSFTSSSTPETSIDTSPRCHSPTSLYESHPFLDPSTKTARDEIGYSDDENEEGDDAGILAVDGLVYPRLDYVLRETVIDTYGSEWIVAVKSHFKYWANRYVTDKQCMMKLIGFLSVRDLVLHMVNVMMNDK